MIGINNKSVNVSRLMLLEKLRENLSTHRQQYAEAVSDYRKRIQIELSLALKQVNDETYPTDSIPKLAINFSIPTNHEKDYVDVIEMLEFSVDETINLDRESFKAYIKNEWSWSQPFNVMMASTKQYISGAI